MEDPLDTANMIMLDAFAPLCTVRQSYRYTRDKARCNIRVDIDDVRSASTDKDLDESDFQFSIVEVQLITDDDEDVVMN